VGVDISSSALEKARAGIYPYNSRELEYVSEEDIDCLFMRNGDSVKVREWIRAGVSWIVEDGRSPKLLETLGPQDVVMANNFLIHMPDHEAEACLRDIIRLVRPGGYIFTYGLNLDVRAKVARTQGLTPIDFKIEEVHNADRSIRAWPLDYWGLEPLDKGRADWKVRYATVFQVPLHG
jgi:SAM-dependent methyltransferase